MNKETLFFIYLLENYADKKGMMTKDVLFTWDKKGITNRIYDNYEIYHQEAIENAFNDIDSLVTR